MYLNYANMKLPTPHQQALIDALDESGLSPALMRDLTMILPFIFNEDWHTSISLRSVMRNDNSYTRKELLELSQKLYNIYAKTKLLKRQEKRKLYWHHNHHKHVSHWAYTLDWTYCATIVPDPELEQYRKDQAEREFLRSTEEEDDGFDEVAMMRDKD
jgi:hypothetical protein